LVLNLGVTFLASSSRDRFVHIFDASKDYQLVATLDDHSAAITAVRFTFSSITSNLQLISCSADKSLIFRSISKVKIHGFFYVQAKTKEFMFL
jgi:WD40 repeat protein